MDQARSRIQAILPPPEALWSWCLERSQVALLGVLAFIVAASVDAVRRKGDRPDAVRLTHTGQIVGAIGLDMRTWFVPDAENCFDRINRAGILAAIDGAKGTHAPALGKLKKNALAQRAAALVADSGWVPEPLRPVPKIAALRLRPAVFSAGLSLDPIAPRPPIHVSLLELGDSSDFLTIMFPLCSILPLLPKDFWSGTSGKPGEVSLTV